jgi:hypothetical protein
MDNKFTAGQWRPKKIVLNEDKPKGIVYAIWKQDSVNLDSNKDDKSISIIQQIFFPSNNSDITNKVEMEANIILMAASPRMYNVLKELIFAYRNNLQTPRGMSDAIILIDEIDKGLFK